MTSQVPKIYFDACCFIDLAQKNMGLAAESGRDDHVFYCSSFINASKNTDAKLFTSFVTLSECTYVKGTPDTKGNREKVLDDRVKNLFRAMLLSAKSGVYPVAPTPIISERARDLIWDAAATNIKIGPLDAIHIATAIEMGCSHFITTDNLSCKELLKTAHKLIVCKADHAISLLPDRYKQSNLSGVGDAVSTKAKSRKK